ncbi:MAG: sigma-54-dependent transcriptional regulator [Alkalispirochaetaceae bacterium]
MKRILVVDDEAGIREVLDEILRDEGYEVLVAADGLEALKIVEEHPIDLVLLDVWLPGKGGIDVLKEIVENYTGIQTVMISGHGSIDLAVKALKLGAFDFIEKPLSLDRVLTIVSNAMELGSLRRENAELRNKLTEEDHLIGQSKAINEVRKIISQAAGSDARIMITGENGTGKELVAREIHRRSERAQKPFVEVNCAAIPDNLIESELFGHEKGSFTGAVQQRRGKFELADGGTLFLDEVADMSLSAQAKMLRVIQEMTFQRIGGEKTIEVDVRVIVATNKDIQEEIHRGRFREDLFFRLNVIPVTVPPLRERQEDVPLLLAHFLKEFSGEGTPRRFSEEALEYLQRHPWPGNVRELKNFVERISIMSSGEVISLKEVQEYLDEGPKGGEDPLESYLGMGLTEARDAFERDYLVQKLRENGNNISRTAQQLGIYPSNLHAKIKKFGIEIGKK